MRVGRPARASSPAHPGPSLDARDDIRVTRAWDRIGIDLVQPLEPGDRVLVIDDVLATGGTLAAAMNLVRGFDATLVGAATVIELEFLGGRQKLASNAAFHSLLRY